MVPRLSIHGLNKTFGDTKVLTEVDLVLHPGEVHGLAGQNGCGKSTLVKILTGIYTPDAGATVAVDGRPVRLPVRWPEVHAAGVSVVHQDLGLLDELSVADNICIGGYPHRRYSHRIDRRRQRDISVAALRRIGSDIDPDRRAESLSAPERAEVAVARALRDHTPGSGLLVMDESTRSMTGAELARVHAILRQLAAEGTTIVLISHSLPELLEVTDRVTILRDGRVSGAGLDTSGLTEREIAHRMLGSDALGADLGSAASPVDRPTPPTRRRSFAVTGLAGKRFGGITFEAGAGEVVGVTGLPGSGYEDIPYLMTGATRATAGRAIVGDDHLDLSRASIAQCLRAGLVLVPEQRGRHGLALEMSVQDNLTVPNLRRNGRRLFVGRSWQRRDADEAVRTFDIRPRSTDRLVKTLSGGNQQKVLLAKWMGASPTVLVLHEPTQAVDVGARRDILLAVTSAAARGIAVILVSGEPADLIAVCDRVLVADPVHGMTEVAVSSADDLLEHIYRQHSDEKVGTSHA